MLKDAPSSGTFLTSCVPQMTLDIAYAVIVALLLAPQAWAA